ncbi:MAG TPA: 1-deoxy-D-xylulose-5-phosphate reductoisomerase [Candidatus Aminicenantes bacterium]|nr:1-deoxy-D-xylulose-5-phosphate reductoisomerase [Candidatus Aminicenantes bacterium]HPS99925.1 1-deoxy-D-xylulose-5-phosphate reductoisomerase [Candidatus Aminicenantes bacterium]
MISISLLGSTGSIGVSTLDVLRRYPDRFRVVFLGAGKNLRILSAQIREFHPRAVSLSDAASAVKLKALFPELEVWSGEEGLLKGALMEEADKVVVGVSGMSGLMPTLAALQAGKPVALANKEAVVEGGALLKPYMDLVIPVDSEHSSLFQLLRKHDPAEIKRVYITASGGPFLHRSLSEEITREEVLHHPTWSMGPKITVDSATMANKALEIIEAANLFGLQASQIGVVVQPQSVIHSLVEFCDGTFHAQMSVPDMRFPIGYALFFPERAPKSLREDLPFPFGPLELLPPNTEKFPFLPLAYDVINRGGARPIVFNAANEAAVELFLQGHLPFHRLIGQVKEAYDTLDYPAPSSAKEVLSLHREVKKRVEGILHERWCK